MRREAERLGDWMDSVKHSGFLSTLPCRECELTNISDFISQCFQTDQIMVMTLSGEKNTGKTSAIKLCAAMSEYERQIIFVDCGFSTEFEEPERATGKQLIVFDQFGGVEEDVVRICERLRCSCIFVSRDVIGLASLPACVNKSHLRFGRYTWYELREILNEKLSDVIDIVPQRVVADIASQVSKASGDVTDAIGLLVSACENRVKEQQEKVEVMDLPFGARVGASSRPLQSCHFGFCEF